VARGRNFAGPWRKTPDRLVGVVLVRLYQLTLSGFLGNTCRHLPTCSEYAYEAIARHGLWSGGWLALFRVARCGPGGTHGIDNVPESLPASMPWWMPWRFWRAGIKSEGR
jgi:putative membrane protein insertion efficiency factor